MNGRKLALSIGFVIALASAAPKAFADCTIASQPTRTWQAGAIVYNSPYQVMEYCDGTNWRTMMGGGVMDPSLPTLTDVDDALAPADGNVLAYDSASGEWTAGAAGIGVEDDPQVDATTNNQWCRGTGTQVTCDQVAPLTSESDPQVGATTNNNWCRGDGSAVQCDQTAPSSASGTICGMRQVTCYTSGGSPSYDWSSPNVQCQGSTLTITCKAQGSPPPVVSGCPAGYAGKWTVTAPSGGDWPAIIFCVKN